MTLIKTLLLVMVALPSAALAQTDLRGCWRNVRNDIGPCYIEQQGYNLIFTNEYGSRSYGHFYTSNDVVAVTWNNTRARVAARGTVLVWDGDGEWNRDYYCRWDQ